MSETLVREQTITAEQFYDRYAGKDGRIELVNGKVVEMPPAGPVHGLLDSRLFLPLAQHVKEHALGEVFINTGFILRRSPDLVRGPDEAFVAAERIAASPMPERGFWEMVPDLVVEIVSPDDTAKALAEKVADYQAAGVRLAWFVYPARREVRIYRPGRPEEVISHEGVLDGEDVVPGFRLELLGVWR